MSRVRHAGVTLAVATTMLGVGTTAALAGWTSHATGKATATSATMPKGNKPTAVLTGSSVAVGWAKSQYGGRAVDITDYNVTRYLGGTASAMSGTTCASTVTGLSCSDTLTATGSYTYTVTPKSGSWTGTESDPSTAVAYTAPPTLTISAINGAGYSNVRAVPVSGTASTSGSVTVKLCPGNVATVCSTGVITAPAATPSGASNAWSTTSASIATTNQTWTVFVTQTNGASARTTFVYDDTLPTTTIGTISVPTGGGSGSVSGTQSTATATASTSPDGAVTVKICSPQNQPVTCSAVATAPTVTSTAGTSSWSATWSSLSPTGSSAKYTLVVSQTDGAGNVQNVTSNFTNN